MYKHMWRIFFFLVLALASLDSAFPGSVRAESGKGHGYSSTHREAIQQPDVQAVVLRVIDGDSLVVNIPTFPDIIGKDITVRIASCDTPEKNDKNPVLRAKAGAAKRFTATLAPPGSTVWLRQIRRDKYFRLLARVEAAGYDITDALIAEGLALPYEGGKKSAFLPVP